jgi:hypothetical protein
MKKHQWCPLQNMTTLKQYTNIKFIWIQWFGVTAKWFYMKILKCYFKFRIDLQWLPPLADFCTDKGRSLHRRAHYKWLAVVTYPDQDKNNQPCQYCNTGMHKVMLEFWVYSIWTSDMGNIVKLIRRDMHLKT